MTQPTNFYLIKDLSRLSGHSTHTLKFYLKLGLIQETGRSQETRFRYFDDSTLATLQRIRELQKTGKSLANILELLLADRKALIPAIAAQTITSDEMKMSPAAA